MTIWGSILGYDDYGGDIMGINRDPGQNCVVCGMSVYHHSEQKSQECMAKYCQELRRQRLEYYRRKYPKI